MTIEQVLYLDDTSIRHLVASNVGDEINDPFHGSALHSLTSAKRDLPEDHEPGVALSELCLEDQTELSSIAGMDAIFDDGDYLGEFED